MLILRLGLGGLAAAAFAFLGRFCHHARNPRGLACQAKDTWVTCGCAIRLSSGETNRTAWSVTRCVTGHVTAALRQQGLPRAAVNAGGDQITGAATQCGHRNVRGCCRGSSSTAF